MKKRKRMPIIVTTFTVMALIAIVAAVVTNENSSNRAEATSFNSLPKPGDSNVLAVNGNGGAVTSTSNHSQQVLIHTGVKSTATWGDEEDIKDRMQRWYDNDDLQPLRVGDTINWNFAGKQPVCGGQSDQHRAYAVEHWQGEDFGLDLSNNRLSGRIRLPDNWRDNANHKLNRIKSDRTYVWRVILAKHISSNQHKDHPGRDKATCFYETVYMMIVQHTVSPPPTRRSATSTPRPTSTPPPAAPSKRDCSSGGGPGSWGDPVSYPNWVNPDDRGSPIRNTKSTSRYERLDWPNRQSKNDGDPGTSKGHYSGWHEHVRNEGCHNHWYANGPHSH